MSLSGSPWRYLGPEGGRDPRRRARGGAPAGRRRTRIDGPYIQHQLARIYLLVGEPGEGARPARAAARMPYYLSPGWLRIDPNFDPLRGNPDSSGW